MNGIFKLAPTAQAFVADPAGTYFVGRSWLVFAMPEMALSGIVLWGQPDVASLELALPIFERRPDFAAHPSVVDVRMVTGIDPLVFDKLARFFVQRREAFSRAVTRAAALHSEGLVGAVAAGFAASINMLFPVRAFADPWAGLAWLVPNPTGATKLAFAELADVVAAARATPVLLHQLSLLLEANLGLSVAQAADALGLSSRSFQRRLTELGTTFQAQLDATRVRVASRLLDSSDANVTHIAHAVGMRSAYALTVLFTRTVGRSPVELRAQHQQQQQQQQQQSR